METEIRTCAEPNFRTRNFRFLNVRNVVSLWSADSGVWFLGQQVVQRRRYSVGTFFLSAENVILP